MDHQLLEIGVKLKKGVIFAVRWCLGSVCSHPFFVGFLCFLIFLYRLSPFIFSLLVSASPILVCTAILLGTLLSYGQPNIPEIEIEEEKTDEFVSAKTGISGDAVVVEKIERCFVDGFSEGRSDEADQSTEQLYQSAGKLGELHRERVSDDTVPLIQERSQEFWLNDGKVWERNRDLDDLKRIQKTEWIEERVVDEGVIENHYAPIATEDDERLGSEDEKSEADSFDSEKVNVDSLDSLPHSPRTRFAEWEKEMEEEDGALDSGSDLAESSSPDASMADIMPMLDELHPLLDEEAPKPLHMSGDGPDAASEISSTSSTSSHESDNKTENHEDSEVADDNDEEEAQEDREEQTKSAIKWTEEDQKNLMDLGSSEIERNQRLENLILRRSATKNMVENVEDLEVANDDNEGGEDEDDAQEDKEEETQSAIKWTEEDQKNLMDLGSSEIERNQILENLILRRSARKNMAENHEDFEVADDDNEVGEDEDDVQEDKEEEGQSAIKWTEEDQKNLMDLGSSEIERNQRLENLILRRRARKNVNMFPERNLMNLESSDLPFNIAPISTRRQNPFDLPHDSYDDSGLPSIPGSAPSVLLPRRNPFDIPYDSGEEKPNLLGDEFHEEFGTFESRESFFRRHESFNVRPSSFAPGRQEGQKSKMRPYFIPEHTFSEQSVYSQFQRQSSELSDSKVSSVPETESVDSSEDSEDRKLPEEDNSHEVEVISLTKEVTIEGPSEDLELISHPEVTEESLHQVPELASIMESVSKHVGHESESSEEEDSLELGQVKMRDVEVGEIYFQSRDVADHYQQESITEHMEAPATEYHPNSEAVEWRYSRDSGSSSLSEVSEGVSTETRGEGLLILKETRDGVAEEPGISTQASVESIDLTSTSTLVADIPDRIPVYDSSPREVRKNLSSSLISSDVHQESDPGLPSVLVKRTVTLINRESEGTSQEIGTNISCNLEAKPESSTADTVDKSRPIDVVNIRHQDNANTDLSGLDQRSESEGSLAAPSITAHVPIPLESLVEASVEENLREQHRWGEVPSSSADKNIHSLVKYSDDQSLDRSLEEKCSQNSNADNRTEISEAPFEGHPRTEHSSGAEETILHPSPDSDVHHEAEEKSISTSAEGNMLLFYDKTIDEPNFNHLNEVQASSTLVESSSDIPTTQKPNVPEIQLLDHGISSNISLPIPPEFIFFPSRALNTNSSQHVVQTTVEETDEIKEMDGLLSELDNVGDFSTNQWGSGSSEFKKHIVSVGENLSSAHPAETSTARVAEVNPVEENKMEGAMHSGSSREEIHVYEENIEYIPELQTSKTSIAERNNILKMNFNERDERDGWGSPGQQSSKVETFFNGNEVQATDFMVSHNHEDSVSVIPDVEATHIKDVDSVLKKAELPSGKSEIVVGDAQVSNKGQDVARTSSGMPELEAGTIEDIELAFKLISANRIEKPVVLEPPHTDMLVGENITKNSDDGTLHTNPSVTTPIHETSAFEVRPFDDAALDYKQLNDGSAENLKLPNSFDHALQLVESGEARETSWKLGVTDPVPLEHTYLPIKQVPDANKEKLVPNLDDGSIETKDDKEGTSGEVSSVKEEVRASTPEKPDREVKEPKDLHRTASVMGTGKTDKKQES